VTYTPGQVAHLLPYLWDEYLPSGLDNPVKADPDMPRGSTDVSHKGTWMAMLADLRLAWEEPVLTDDERRRVLHFALLGGDLDNDGIEGFYKGSPVGPPAQHIAKHEGKDPRTVRGSINRAAEKLADVLNGIDRSEEWEDSDD